MSSRVNIERMRTTGSEPKTSKPKPSAVFSGAGPARTDRYLREFDKSKGCRIPSALLVFAWNLRALTTPFEQRSLALNTIELGRAWHWRLLPAGWLNTQFVFRHGQLKTKRAFAKFFPNRKETEAAPLKKVMKVKKPVAGEFPVSWEVVQTVFGENPKLKKAGVLAGAQALLNEHLENEFGRFSFDIDLHTAREVASVHAGFSPAELGKIQLISAANSEMYIYTIGTTAGPIKLEIAKPFLRPMRPSVKSKTISGLKVTDFSDIIDAKISALSSRGFARDLVDIYAAHKQRQLNWKSLLLAASQNESNDYNPVELETNLKLLEQELTLGKQDIPCARPPSSGELKLFVQEMRDVNAEVARQLSQIDDDSDIQ